MEQLTGVFLVALLVGFPAFAILRPDVLVRWAKRAHPELSEDDPTVLWLARLVGVGGLGVAVFCVVMIVRSFSR